MIWPLNRHEVKRLMLLIDLKSAECSKKVQCSKLFWRCNSNFGFKHGRCASKVILLGKSVGHHRID
ncbi:hypothetical protein DPM35_16765 [Mesorhizobium atlanticum]|uniref:Uncharacterized protein n=1 Tax=Mesorhizobium atlanticum TaxID=2233532 RepID=A0A330GWE9_9HYPH|nr:hypothetical protein DPM35_16765 [Mesorhizobium atlanticum]